MTRDGKLPSESVVEAIERRFRGTQTGALAKLLRGRIKFENKDHRGAVALLNTDEFEKLTSVGDYALWLRGQALHEGGDHQGAMAAFERLIEMYPDSMRVNAARLGWAASATRSGRGAAVPAFLAGMITHRSADAALATAEAYEATGDRVRALEFYRKAYIYGGTGDIGKTGEAKLTEAGQSLEPQNAEEARVRANRLLAVGDAALAYDAYTALVEKYPAAATGEIHLKRLTAAVRAKDMAKARTAFDAISSAAEEKEAAYAELTVGYAKNKLWPQARAAADEMRRRYPTGKLTPKTWVDAGYAARDARNKGEETYFLRTALINYPRAIEVAGAQFELAWLEHEAKNHARASELLIEHLAHYADRDTTNRGRAGYWSARNAELAGKLAEACTLYDAVVYRYGANWYGHLGMQRLEALRGRGQCQRTPDFPANSPVPRAAANLKSITVAPETATERELARAEKSDQLSTIGLFDWAIEELREAKKTAEESPKINLALAQHYQLKGDNVAALLALAKSYPDYSQMFPEEMSREEWAIFYPHVAWDQITRWAKHRKLDPYQVAGVIRQESVFNPSAVSSARAYGLMQLLLPTARITARKNGTTAALASYTELFQPALNIELGTAYMREQLDKYGRVEYMAVAYNAGPGRVVTWRRTLPLEMDEFVEAIPFRETRGYVQGIIRNTAQYRRLYELDGSFKPNVGTRPVRAAVDSLPAEQLAAEFPEVAVSGGNTGE
jgi:soluble lytic murein transglycosylase